MNITNQTHGGYTMHTHTFPEAMYKSKWFIEMNERIAKAMKAGNKQLWKGLEMDLDGMMDAYEEGLIDENYKLPC